MPNTSNWLLTKTKLVLMLYAVIAVIATHKRSGPGLERAGHLLSHTPIATNIILLPILILIFSKFLGKDYYLKLKSANVLAFLYASFVVVGNSFLRTNSFDYITKDITSIINSSTIWLGLFLLFKTFLSYLYGIVLKTNHSYKCKEESLFTRIFDKKPFLTSVACILISWVPYMIAMFPITISPDPSMQLLQYYGVRSGHGQASFQNENQTINNHHPVFHTFLLGGTHQLVKKFSNDYIGLFAYALMQTLVYALSLATAIAYMHKTKVHKLILYASLGIFCLVPVFPFYSMTAVKDTYFAAFMILYTIFLYHLTTSPDSKIWKKIGFPLLILLAILMFLVRHNGLHLVLATLPLTLITCQSKRIKTGVLISILAIVTAYIGYKATLPMLNIAGTTKGMVLFLPMQQTGRYVTENYDNLEEWEIEAIDRLIPINMIAEHYAPSRFDPLFNKIRGNISQKDIENYLIAWAYGFTKRPMTYVNATLSTCWGYFLPSPCWWYIYTKQDHKLKKVGIDIEYLPETERLRSFLIHYGTIFPYIPIVGLYMNLALMTWVLLFLVSLLLVTKQKKHIVFLSPALCLVAITILWGVNSYFRYYVPIISLMPLLIGLTLKTIEQTKQKIDTPPNLKGKNPPKKRQKPQSINQ